MGRLNDEEQKQEKFDNIEGRGEVSYEEHNVGKLDNIRNFGGESTQKEEQEQRCLDNIPRKKVGGVNDNKQEEVEIDDKKGKGGILDNINGTREGYYEEHKQQGGNGKVPGNTERGGTGNDRNTGTKTKIKECILEISVKIKIIENLNLNVKEKKIKRDCT